MANMFIEKLNGEIINVNLLQTVFIDKEDNTNVVWYFRNGETYVEDLATNDEAINRYNNVKGILLGSSSSSDLEQTIIQQQNTITELNKIINNAETLVSEINNEEV